MTIKEVYLNPAEKDCIKQNSVIRQLLEQLNADTPVYNVVNHGADPTGVADSAPAFRAVMGSNRVILVPPGTYLFKTVVSNAIGSGTSPVNPDSFSNFLITGYGASINMDSSIAANPVFNFTRCTNFQIVGLTLNPTVPISGLNSGMGFISVVDFRVADITLGANLVNQAFFGDWMVNGVFENIYVTSGSNTFDLAYQLHMRYDNIHATSTSTTAGSCFNINTDSANVGLNSTGYSFTQTEDVTITRCDVSGNYNTGFYASTGKQFKLSNNYWHDLPGVGAIAPTAVQVGYKNGGAASSTGAAVRGIVIDGDKFNNIGAIVAGFGVYIDPSAIANSDVISSVVVSNCNFDTITSVGVNLVTTASAEKMVLGGGNNFKTITISNVSTNFNTIARNTAGTPIFSSSPTFVTQPSFTYTPGASLATIDASPQAGITVLNSSNQVFCPGGQGMLALVINSTSVSAQLAIAGGGSVQAINTAANWTMNTTAPAAGNQALAFGASAYQIYNNTGGSAVYKVMVFRPA